MGKKKYRYECVIPGIDLGFDSDIDFGLFFDEHNNLSLTRTAVEVATSGGPIGMVAKVVGYQSDAGKEMQDFAYSKRHTVLGIAGIADKRIAIIDVALNELEAIEDLAYSVMEGETVLVDGEERIVANSELVGSAADHAADGAIGLVTLGFGEGLKMVGGKETTKAATKVALQVVNWVVSGSPIIESEILSYTDNESLTKQYFKNRPRAPYRIDGGYEDAQGRIWTSQDGSVSQKQLVADGRGYFDENGNYVALTGQQSIDPNTPPVTPKGPTVMGPYSSEDKMDEFECTESEEDLKQMKKKAQEDREQAKKDSEAADKTKAKAEKKEKKAQSKVAEAKKKTEAARNKRDKAEQRVEKYKSTKEGYEAMIKDVKEQLFAAAINGDKKTERDAKKILEDLEAKRKEYERKEKIAREDARRAQKEYEAASGELESAYLAEDLSKALGDSADLKKSNAENKIKQANANEEYADYGLSHPLC